MGQNKLSNTYGLNQLISAVPERISSYSDGVHEEVKTIRNKSLYYSPLNVAGMLTCVILLALGVILTFLQQLVFEYIHWDISALLAFSTELKFFGVFLIIVSVHGISKMFFGNKLRSTEKTVDQIGQSFRAQYDTAIQQGLANQLVDVINSNGDLELEERSQSDTKLFNSIASMQKQENVFSKLVMISRIVLPILIYIATILLVLKGESLGIMRFPIAFLLMFIFNGRLTLLLEYKVGAWVRALMCIPSLIYGAVLYFANRSVLSEYDFLTYEILLKVPDAAREYVSSGFIMCLLQVIVLVLAVVQKDYYSERNRLRDGVPKHNKVVVTSDNQAKETQSSSGTHNRWYVAYGIFFYSLFSLAYVIAISYGYSMWEEIFDTTGSAIFVGVILGAVWRIICPVWPEGISKTIRKYWGAKYSTVVSMFVIVLMISILFMAGFSFEPLLIICIISAVVSSWIVFAVLYHFWG